MTLVFRACGDSPVHLDNHSAMAQVFSSGSVMFYSKVVYTINKNSSSFLVDPEVLVDQSRVLNS